jgi:hypothetical protein
MSSQQQKYHANDNNSNTNQELPKQQQQQQLQFQESPLISKRLGSCTKYTAPSWRGEFEKRSTAAVAAAATAADHYDYEGLLQAPFFTTTKNGPSVDAPVGKRVKRTTPLPSATATATATPAVVVDPLLSVFPDYEYQLSPNSNNNNNNNNSHNNNVIKQRPTRTGTVRQQNSISPVTGGSGTGGGLGGSLHNHSRSRSWDRWSNGSDQEIHRPNKEIYRPNSSASALSYTHDSNQSWDTSYGGYTPSSSGEGGGVGIPVLTSTETTPDGPKLRTKLRQRGNSGGVEQHLLEAGELPGTNGTNGTSGGNGNNVEDQQQLHVSSKTMRSGRRPFPVKDKPLTCCGIAIAILPWWCASSRTTTSNSHGGLKFSNSGSTTSTSSSPARGGVTRWQLLLLLIAGTVIHLHANHRIAQAHEEMNMHVEEKSMILSQMEWLDKRAKEVSRKTIAGGGGGGANSNFKSSNNVGPLDNSNTGEVAAAVAGGGRPPMFTLEQQDNHQKTILNAKLRNQVHQLENRVDALQATLQQTARQQLQTIFNDGRMMLKEVALEFSKTTTTTITTASGNVEELDLVNPIVIQLSSDTQPYTSWTWLDQLLKHEWDLSELRVVSPTLMEITTKKHGSNPSAAAAAAAAAFQWFEKSVNTQDVDATWVVGLKRRYSSSTNFGDTNIAGLTLTIHANGGTCGSTARDGEEEDSQEICFGKVVYGFDSLEKLQTAFPIIQNSAPGVGGGDGDKEASSIIIASARTQ